MLLSPKYFIYNIFPVLIFLAIPCYFFLGYRFSYIEDSGLFTKISIGSGVFMSVLLWYSMRKRYHHVMAFCYMICMLVVIYSPMALLTVNMIPVGHKEVQEYPVVQRYVIHHRRSGDTFGMTIINEQRQEQDLQVSEEEYGWSYGVPRLKMYKYSGLLGFPFVKMTRELAVESYHEPDIGQ